MGKNTRPLIAAGGILRCLRPEFSIYTFTTSCNFFNALNNWVSTVRGEIPNISATSLYRKPSSFTNLKTVRH